MGELEFGVQEKIDNAKVRIKDRETLIRSFYLNTNNLNELSYLLEKAATPGSILAKNATNDTGYLSHLALIDYSLLMATCSIFSFNETKNKLLMHYKNTDFYLEFRNENQRLPTGEVEFFLSFRNFLAKYNMAPWRFNLRYHEDGNFCVMLLERDSLLEWENWSSRAKNFLRQQPETFRLSDVLDGYMSTMIIFWKSMLERLHDLQDSEIAEINNLIFTSSNLTKR